MAARDEYADSSRTGRTKSREDCMYDPAPPLGSIAEEAKMDRAAGRPTVGTRGYADKEAFDRD